MSKNRRRPTLGDVAEASGVSEMTVSRVLRGRGTVSARTRTRVESIVEKMGYVRNNLAGSLATSRSNQVAVIIPSIVNNVFTEVISGLAEELDKADYNAVVGISDYDIVKEERLLYSMLSWRPAGVVVANIHHTERARNVLAATDIPVVEIMNLTQSPIDMSVGLNQAAAGAALARYMLSRGYQRFGAVGWHAQDHAASARFTAIEHEITDAGARLRAPELNRRPPNFTGGKRGLAKLLDIEPDLDAVFFSNDTAATGGLIHCLEAGINVPEDLAIAGFSGLDVAQNMPRALTTIATKRFETGKMAARSILNRLAGVQTPMVRDMGFRLIEGETA